MDQKDRKDEEIDYPESQANHDRPRHENTLYFKREIHFVVESPSGEQMPMRLKPEMTVSTMLHLACKKFNLSSEDHYLVFNNKEMNLVEHLKFYNIVSNSIIKMFEGKKMSDQPDVFVSVRIRDCRIGSVFRMTDNVWDILSQLLAEKSYEVEMVPIVIYTKYEFIGKEVLQALRLRDIGVTKGTCKLRFLQLKQEDLDERKMKEDDETMLTLESLELKASGPTTDVGAKTVHFNVCEEAVEDLRYIGERRALAFHLSDPETPEEEVQEEYFDLLLEEIQALFAEVCRKKDISHMQICAKEAKIELAKLKQIRHDFDETLIRVIFPDRSCLQFLFLPEERISDVKSFIMKFLKFQQDDFDLYTLENSEKVLLDDSDTLGYLRLVPIGRIFYETKEKRVLSIEQYFTDEVTLNMVQYSVGKEAALMLRSDSLDRFIQSVDERQSSSRKSTGGFLSKFIRGSIASTKGQPSMNRSYGGSSSQSKHWKQSQFVPKNRSFASSLRKASEAASQASREGKSIFEQKTSA